MNKTIAILIVITLLPRQAGIEIDLHMYRRAAEVWQDLSLASCQTDPAGQCQIEAKAPLWEDGLVRGYLIVGEYGTRPLIWDGGELPMTVELNQAPHVDLRYDTLPENDQVAPVVIPVSNRPSIVLLGLGLVMVILTYFLYRQARR